MPPRSAYHNLPRLLTRTVTLSPPLSLSHPNPGTPQHPLPPIPQIVNTHQTTPRSSNPCPRNQNPTSTFGHSQNFPALRPPILRLNGAWTTLKTQGDEIDRFEQALKGGIYYTARGLLRHGNRNDK